VSEVADAVRRAFAAAQRGDFASADAICRELLARDGSYLPALRIGGVVAGELGRTDDAIDLLARVVARDPDDAPMRARLAWLHRVRADAASAQGDAPAALADYDRALALDAAQPDTHFNRANVLLAQNRVADALAGYDRALALRPASAEALLNRGVALGRLARHDDALQSLDAALSHRPSYVEALVNRANALRALDRHDEALASYARALAIDPSSDFLPGAWLHARMTVCDWDGIEEAFAALERGVLEGARASPPFPLTALASSPDVLLAAARTWVAARFPARATTPAPHAPGPRLRVGYFAATLGEHATAHLAGELFECHDRTAFEIVVFAYGPVSARIAAALDRIVDIANVSDEAAARLARDHRIDIAVDLMGYTRDGRPGIFAWRAAPVQVAYLGYPGTMGAPYVDYAIADRTVVPPEHEEFYTEKIVRMPVCYQVNDGRRPRPADTPKRVDAGLPENGFVYGCFNNNWKTTPRVFGAWMRILREVEGSVLWLMEDNRWAARNLRGHAVVHGVDPARLVFAPRVPISDHLARHRLADLFLDTLPYNAHTTASDALWMGLPVLTCLGDTFAGRVAASLLRAAGVPELVAPTLDDYEARAVALARDPAALAAIRRRLDAATAPFDAATFTRDLERAYRTMAARQRAGLAPAHVD
jgi:predicted O-linked N-acetylglucosamine transferase (SPINDLY family)